ncbi:hypothetical protein [Natronorubrum bangense]|uniref:Uncharacterized protein n=2 Tax=Natronorubrum bangense TaxID=61858 RepID=L9WC40_9EURY|nr:hypothetical protein [Natronorubrum bangense]ELY46932.1 hypothetical protein C494_13586 [Natronorubrum bangense JCM 10635]QCC56534.1 hypothetical protein DV706_18705 [Natronorubrum bangense]
MSTQKRDDLLIAVALTEFSVHFEQIDPELSERAWQLAANRLIEYDVDPEAAVSALEIGRSR